MLIVTRLGVRMVIYGFEVPFGFVEPHYVLHVLFRVCHLFALLLARRRVVSALLLQLLVVLLHKLLDFPTLLGIVVRGVVHWTMRPSVITAGRLMRVLVTLGTSSPTHHGSHNYGGRSPG
jgi:hypothetical protein